LSGLSALKKKKATIATDIKEVYSEAKSVGFDVKIMRELIKLRKLDASEMTEQELMLETYKRALGMQTSLDLGDAT
jgi:uncharacterized protein (UPF0335 family)